MSPNISSTTLPSELPTRVLFVDDSEPIGRSFVRCLKDSALDVTVATTHAQAVEEAKTNAYGVIVVDLNMPEGSGFDLCEQLRPLQPAASFAIVSGDLTVDLACDAVNEYGVSYIIHKPWQTEELVSLLNRAVEDAWERFASRRIVDSLLRQTPGSASTDSVKRGAAPQPAADPRQLAAKALLQALTARAPEKKESCHRIAAYARKLAADMGLDDEAQTDIEVAALVHDVGMLAIPAEVVAKKGALTPDEWRLVRTHSELGARLLEDLDHMAVVRRIVMQHHERWQGDGYPQGLRGTEICIGARILAVVDAFDALTAGRPHRDGVGYDIARAEIFRCQGTQFDSQVVEAFLKVSASEWRATAEGALLAHPVTVRAA